MNRKFFFDTVRPMFPHLILTAPQVEGMGLILDAFDRDGAIALDHQAYMLATAFHETGATMQPVRETFADSDSKARAILETSYAQGHMKWVKRPYWRIDRDGRCWLGRGLVQLTHKVNYELAGQLIGVDLVTDPTVAMRFDVAIKIMIEGMRHGIFTGKALDTYLDGVDEDAAEDYREFVNARRIINGVESADIVARAALTFEKALKGEHV